MLGERPMSRGRNPSIFWVFKPILLMSPPEAPQGPGPGPGPGPGSFLDLGSSMRLPLSLGTRSLVERCHFLLAGHLLPLDAFFCLGTCLLRKHAAERSKTHAALACCLH
mmetsp:Transcript_4666/g.8566  ORF Transcript_4666/g.8566 Transcript_4666/m.8566 type:complete len:109 (-) Transcript_4666:1388-1714(-)